MSPRYNVTIWLFCSFFHLQLVYSLFVIIIFLSLINNPRTSVFDTRGTSLACFSFIGFTKVSRRCVDRFLVWHIACNPRFYICFLTLLASVAAQIISSFFPSTLSTVYRIHIIPVFPLHFFLCLHPATLLTKLGAF